MLNAHAKNGAGDRSSGSWQTFDMGERIVIAGASGLIGRELVTRFRARDAQVMKLVRRPPRQRDEVFWNPDGGIVPHDTLANATALISLNGASVGRLPWTKSYKKALRNSRLNATRSLAEAIIELQQDAPRAWLSASASGWYGSQPGVTLTEKSPHGGTFLARLCVLWEEAAKLAAQHTRVTFLRTAPVIHPAGVLKPMMLLTRAGLGGPIGRGTQMWPWISLTDEARGIMHALDQGITGPVNLTGPVPATAAEIGRELARCMRRPFLVPAPEFALNTVLGKDATESLLTSDALVEPERLEHAGFTFQHPTAQEAIREALA